MVFAGQGDGDVERRSWLAELAIEPHPQILVAGVAIDTMWGTLSTGALRSNWASLYLKMARQNCWTHSLGIPPRRRVSLMDNRMELPVLPPHVDQLGGSLPVS